MALTPEKSVIKTGFPPRLWKTLLSNREHETYAPLGSWSVAKTKRRTPPRWDPPLKWFGLLLARANLDFDVGNNVVVHADRYLVVTDGLDRTRNCDPAAIDRDALLGERVGDVSAADRTE